MLLDCNRDQLHEILSEEARLMRIISWIVGVSKTCPIASWRSEARNRHLAITFVV